MTGMKDLQERLLISRVKQQDRRAADKLIRLYYNEIYAYAFRQTGDKDRAMDLTQEIFMAALQSIGRYDGKKASFRTWLYRIASHKFVDWFRQSCRTGTIRWITLEEMNVEPIEALDLEKLVGEKDFADRVFQWLKTKDETLETLFRLKFYGDATFDEIGEIMGLPVSTIKTRYYAALKSMRKEFEQ